MRSFLLVLVLLVSGVALAQTPPASPASDVVTPAAPTAPASDVVAPVPAPASTPSVAPVVAPSATPTPASALATDAAVAAPPSVVSAPPVMTSEPPVVPSVPSASAVPTAPLPVEEGTPAGAWAAWISGGVVLLLGIWLAIKKFWAAKPAEKP